MLRNLPSKSSHNAAKNATAIKLRKLVPKCSVCRAGLSGHRLYQLASTVVGDELTPRMTEFLGHAKGHEWSQLAEFREWKGDRDNLVAYVIAGPHRGGMVIVTRDPFELYAPDELLLEEPLTAEELDAISGLVPSAGWQDV